MEIMYCPNCGKKNQPGSRFCEQCGCNLIQAVQEQQMKQEQGNKPQKLQKPKKQKKSHLGLVLGITIPVIVIGLAVILILTGVIKLPFMDSGKKLEGTWYEFAATTPEDGLRSLHDLAVLQDKEPDDIRLTMTINKDGSGQMIGGGEGSKVLNWTESDDRYTITCDGIIYTGNFETDDQFVMIGNDDVKLHFSQNISHQIPNQIEVTPTPSPSPTPAPTQQPYWDSKPTEAPSDIGDIQEFEDFDDVDGDGLNEGEMAHEAYIFPNSNTEYLKKSDLKGMSKAEINLAKNELYARHGRKFKSKKLQEYFESKDWYEAKYSPKQWDKKGDTFFFNKYEIKNRDLLKKYENK